MRVGPGSDAGRTGVRVRVRDDSRIWDEPIAGIATDVDQNEQDVRAIRRVGRAVAEALAAMREAICPGITTRELDDD